MFRKSYAKHIAENDLANETAHVFVHSAVIEMINEAGCSVVHHRAIAYGVNYILIGGGIVTIYRNGNYQICGTPTENQRRRLKRVLRRYMS